MVQRKLPNKLGIGSGGIQFQADHVKLSSRQHQEGKNKGTALKKKMKRCRSIKLSDMDGLRSSPLTSRKTISQPHNNSITIKPINGSPNYMKSTSSSEAKKETSQSQVSSRNALTGLEPDSKNLRCSRRTSSTSCNKSTSTLTRTSSSKLVRTLTNSPTFKPARASAKKCSRVALCSDMNLQKSTCSSTLKDSKFPAYLMLNPGGTEYDGTSIIKVCPYTYCSLNGHHHAPLPLLQSFLKSRRHSMKTQRSMKVVALSPRRQVPSGDGTEKLDEEPVDFFVEIYAKSVGKGVEASGGSTQINEDGYSGCGNETSTDQGTDKLASENLSQGSLNSEIDFNEQCIEIISQQDIIETLHEDLKHNDVDGIVAKEKASPWNLNEDNKQEGVSSIDVYHTMFEVIDMEWEKEWSFSTSQSSNEAHSSMESDESHSNLTEAAPADEAEQASDKDTCSQVSETFCYDQISSTEDMFEVFVVLDDEEEEEEVSIEDLTIPSSTEDLHGEVTSGKEKIPENDDVLGIFNEVAESDSLLQVPENSCTDYLKDDGFETTEPFQLQEQEEIDGDYNEVQKAGYFEADQTVTICDFCPEMELQNDGTRENIEAGRGDEAELLIGIHDSFHVLTGADKNDNEVEDNQSEANGGMDESFSTQDIIDESLFAASQYHLWDGQHVNKNIVDNQKNLEEDEEFGKMEMEENSTPGLDLDAAANDESRQKARSNAIANEELPDNHNNRKWRIGRRRHEEIYEESREFNPREPNFLAVVPEADAEKVDLRHQMMEERKNAEDWMMDHALQQAVTKLAPARKKKVALLVEAFETVLPLPVTHFRHASTGFAHGRPIQACN